MDELPPAGWYADPLGRFEHRYWDGTGWTPHVARGGRSWTDPMGLRPGGPQVSPAWDRPGPTNAKAIVSLVLSLVWFLGLGSLAGIVLGVQARREIRTGGGREDGGGIALAGIVIGVAGLVGTILLVLLVLLVSSAGMHLPTPPVMPDGVVHTALARPLLPGGPA